MDNEIYRVERDEYVGFMDIPEEDEEQYYIFNMPDNDERQRGRAIRKITLETQEEVQSFFDALSKVMKENKHD